MPIYEFFCPDCNTVFNFYSPTVNPGRRLSHGAFIPLENFLMGFTPCEKSVRIFNLTQCFFTPLDI